MLPNTFGEQRTLVILVNFQNNPAQPYPHTAAYAVVFNATSDYMREASFQQTWLTGDVYGWYTIAMDSTVCDTATLATLARQAATAAGVNLSSYSRYVYAFPENACAWWGQASVGGNPSQSWINGDFVLDVVAHELGHNLGLYHAHSMDCGASPIAPPCTTSEYGERLDMMGGARGHFGAVMKERLGWLGGSSPLIQPVDNSGTYWLEPFESASAGGAKALKILRSTDPTTGARAWYYVEFRQAIGFDGFVSGYPNVTTGVVVRSGSESSANSYYLLDMTPETASWTDPALVVARSFTDATSGVTVRPASASGAGASVAVTFGVASCSRGNPTVSLSPSQSPWLTAGSTATYTVSVNSTDGPGCTASSFDLSSAVPAGWSALFGSPALTMAPGASASTTMRVTSLATAADGFYTIGAAATNSGDATKSGSASATYVVMSSSLVVLVTSDRASYTRGQTVQLTARVSSGSSTVPGAAVTFRITKPTGAVVSRTKTADANGVATYSMRIGSRDAAGVYQVNAASLNGASGSGTTSFSVTP